MSWKRSTLFATAGFLLSLVPVLAGARAASATVIGGWAVGGPTCASPGVGGGQGGNCTGLIVHTNNGNTWGTQTSGTDQVLNGVDFIAPNNGWAVGGTCKPPCPTGIGTILHYDGTNWSAQSTGTAHPNLLGGVDFTDANTGWTVGTTCTTTTCTNTILHTTTGGGTWNAANAPPGLGTNNALIAVAFLDANQGWTIGPSCDSLFQNCTQTIFHTTTGATSATPWTPQFTGIPCCSQVSSGTESLAFLDATHGWAVGPNGTILNYNGIAWMPQKNGADNWTTSDLVGVTFVDATHGWAVGGIGGNCQATPSPCKGTILRTINGGNTWIAQDMNDPLEAVAFSDLSNGWAVGFDGSTILHTIDGGQSWLPESSGCVAPGGCGGLNDIVILSSSQGVVPEPSSFVLLGMGISGLVGLRRLRRTR